MSINLDSDKVKSLFELFDQNENSVKIKHSIAVNFYMGSAPWHHLKDDSGKNLLLKSIVINRPEITELLLSHGFDPNSWDKELKTGLHYANSPEIAMVLLQKSGIVSLMDSDKNGNLPLHEKLTDGNQKVAQCYLNFRNSPAQVSRSNKNGDTALHLAAQYSPELVTQILLRGADPRKENHEGKSPVDLCKSTSMRNLLEAFVKSLDAQDDALRDAALNDQQNKRQVDLAEQARTFLKSAPESLQLFKSPKNT